MSDDGAALEEVATRLWDERRSVTSVLYKLTVSRLLLAAGEQRFAQDALEEADAAVGLLPDGALRRNEAVRELAERWRVSPDELSLPVLAAEAPAPFDHTFAEHLAAFRGFSAQIESVSRESRALAPARLDHLTDSIGRLTGGELPVDAARCRGPNARTDVASDVVFEVHRIAEELQIQQIGYQATLHSLSWALPPSLVSFLR